MSNEYRLIGPPGCGKTHTLSGMIEQTVNKHGPRSVVVSSFTRAAAKEIASRAPTVAHDNVGTLHSICYRYFDRPKLTVKHLKDWNAKAPEYPMFGGKASLDDPLWDPFGSRDLAGDALFAEMDLNRARCVPPEKWRQTLVGFAQKWEEWKGQNDFWDFTDLIDEAVLDKIPPPKGATIGFFDEVQDCSLLEMQLIRQWADHLPDGVMIAGDPQQAIFGFRGSDPKVFLEPELPEEFYKRLTQSYRLPRAVHEQAMKIIGRTQLGINSEFKPRDADGSVRHMGASSSRFEPLIREVEEEHDRPSMILAPCAYMLEPILRELRARGIAYHNPYRPTNGAWNPRASAAEKLRTFTRPATKGGSWYWGEISRILEWIRGDCLKHGAKAESKRRAEKESTIHKPSQPSRAKLIEVIGEQFITQAFDAIHGGSVADFLDARVLSSKAKQIEYVCALYRKGRLDSNPNLIVGTVHSVKGGQASRVYLIPELSHSGLKQFRYSDRDSRDAVLRMLYVGATRAQDDLVLLTGQEKNSVMIGEVFG